MMLLRRFLTKTRKDDADQSSLENDGTPTSTYTSNVTTAPSHTLSGRDTVREPDETQSSLTDTIGVAETSKVSTTNYIYYRIYTEDRAIPSRTPVAAGDPFLGRINLKARSVLAPRTVKAVKRRIAEVENIKCTNTTIFLTPYSQSRMRNAEKVTILNGTGPGSTPQEPLAFVAKMSDSERSALESDGRSGLASAAEPDTTSPEIGYVFYRIYAEDGSIPSKTPITPGDPFLGRIKAVSVPPPHTAKTVKSSIAKVENIEDGENISLFLTPYSKSPMDEASKVITLNRTGTGPGSTPQEPLALVAKMSDSERSALDSEGKSGLASAAEHDTKSPEIQYLYYLLYEIDYEMPSKVAFDPEEPSLGRIRADSVAPPHSPASIKRCISRVERNPALAWPGHADLFADTLSDAPLEEGHISILPTDGPGLSPDEPMALVQVKIPSIPDGKYLIKNRAASIYWCAGAAAVPVRQNPYKTVYFYATTTEYCKTYNHMQWDVTQDADGNISMISQYTRSSWVGVDMTGSSTVPVPWRLIPVDSRFYYLTTDMNRYSQNPRVPTMQKGQKYDPVSMATLKEGDKKQMWEFIRI